MSAVDPRRTVAARLVEDIDAPDVGPGCLERLANGYMMACPGCATQLVLRVGGDGWTVTEGNAGDPTTLTLSPSIWHHPERNDGGCGWHGYLTAGVFRPC